MSFFTRTLCALPAVAIATGAFAHVSLETREAKAGSSYKAVLKLPHGCDGSPVVKLHVEIPEGVVAVKPMPKPGWQVETKRGAYGKSYPYYHGKQLTEGVKEIVWTGKLLDEHYDEFVFNTSLAADLKAGAIYFPVTQFCEKGEIAWTEIPAPGKDSALVSPAPALVILAQAASAEAGKTFKAGGISVEAPWSRATPGGAQIAGGYLKITNNGKDADRLTGGSFPNAARFEIHEMKTEGGVMTMRPVAGGLEIKPGETVEFKPGGYHLMFMGLKGSLKEGQTVKGTLVFEKAGTLAVEYRVGPIGGSAPAAAGGHKH
jgi:periplasmic copper chaperone A